mgnify:CR=1 FL=1
MESRRGEHTIAPDNRAGNALHAARNEQGPVIRPHPNREARPIGSKEQPIREQAVPTNKAGDRGNRHRLKSAADNGMQKEAKSECRERKREREES